MKVRGQFHAPAALLPGAYWTGGWVSLISDKMGRVK